MRARGIVVSGKICVGGAEAGSGKEQEAGRWTAGEMVLE